MEMKDPVPVRHEDDDPLVQLSCRICPSEEIVRKPGLLIFKLRNRSGAEIIVKRSRFDIDFGAIVRASTRTNEDAVWSPVAIVPTCSMVETISAALVQNTDVFEAVQSLVTEWSQKGRQ